MTRRAEISFRAECGRRSAAPFEGLRGANSTADGVGHGPGSRRPPRNLIEEPAAHNRRMLSAALSLRHAPGRRRIRSGWPRSSAGRARQAPARIRAAQSVLVLGTAVRTTIFGLRPDRMRARDQRGRAVRPVHFLGHREVEQHEDSGAACGANPEIASAPPGLPGRGTGRRTPFWHKGEAAMGVPVRGWSSTITETARFNACGPIVPDSTGGRCTTIGSAFEGFSGGQVLLVGLLSGANVEFFLS